jgi:Ca2+-binding RTX toxin-like protein
MVGGGGGDVIDGGLGVDVCVGGPGTDTFLSCETQVQ